MAVLTSFLHNDPNMYYLEIFSTTVAECEDVCDFCWGQSHPFIPLEFETYIHN